MKAQPDHGTPGPRAAQSDQLARVVAAARKCFRARGVRKTRMGDVAAAAGFARQTLYAFVADRDELVDLAIEARMWELGREIAKRPAPVGQSLEDRLIDLFAFVIERVGGDAEYRLLSDSLPERHAFQFLTGPSALTAVAVAVFEPVLAEAREQGRLRSDVSDELMVEWLQSVLAMLAARDDLTPEHARTLLRGFVVHGILEPAGR